MGFIDLHTHSSCSDGLLSPVELVDWAVGNGLKVLSLTDHDTMSGVDAAMARGLERGIEVVPGVEINAWQGSMSMHILGYWVRADHPAMQEKLAQMQKARQDRNRRIVEKLNRLGLTIQMQELREITPNGQIGRPHIAKLLIDKGVCKDIDQAFAQYLRRGGAAYAERSKYEAGEVIAAIRASGGIAVLAHPAHLDPSLKAIPKLLSSLVKQGLDGVEVYYPSHSNRVTKALKKMADTKNLALTGGSDFHGVSRKRNFPALTGRTFRVSYHLYPILKEKRVKSQGKEL